MLFDVGYVVDNVLHPWKGEKRGVFRDPNRSQKSDLDDAEEGIV